ncbi:MAG: arsenic efflux protein [Clostridia bacterium]|nr:arsenic efflux protein [Clostridia bacterium]
MEHFLEILIHALKDTGPIVPWILVFYVVLQLVECKVDLQKSTRFTGKMGPVIGSATGLIPQCGFSVMAAKLFERKYITLGTLFAIFFATSDEAFIIMLSSGDGATWVLPMLAVKVGIGIAVGYAVDGVLRLFGHRQACVEIPQTATGTPTTTKEIFMQAYLDDRSIEANCSCGRAHATGGTFSKYVVYPLLHALQVALFIFLVNFALTAIIHSVGEEKFIGFMNRNRFLQPFIGCVIGLIPNCASSVVLTEAFLSGAITFGTCVAGLCANAGMGFVVLLKNVRQWKRNAWMIAFSYFVSVAIGVVLNIFPIMV